MKRNAISSDMPIGVANGGTGVATISSGGVLVGKGSANIQNITGLTGQAVIGFTASNPVFSYTCPVSTLFGITTPGITNTVTVSNSDNSDSSSAAKLEIISGGASGGSPYITYVVGLVNFHSVGIDNTANDSFVISRSTGLTTSQNLIITTSGEVTLPLQPAFLAYQSSTQTNKTGNTNYAITCDTEVFDQNADYNNGTGRFTAPVTGRYVFGMAVVCSDITNTTRANVGIITSNRSYIGDNRNASVVKASGGYMSNILESYCDMDAGDAAYPQVTYTGEGSDVVDVIGDATKLYTYFYGYLAC